MTDRKRLIGEVAARHGIRLEEDDPAFLLVTLAELMLRDIQSEFVAAMRQATAEQEEAAERIQEGIGKAIGTAVAHNLSARRIEPLPAQRLPTRNRTDAVIWLSWGLMAALALVRVGFILARFYQ